MVTHHHHPHNLKWWTMQQYWSCWIIWTTFTYQINKETKWAYVAAYQILDFNSTVFFIFVCLSRWLSGLDHWIGHSAWPDGLRTLAGLGSNLGVEESFQLDWTSGHTMRLNSGAGIEGPPVSSLNCDRPLHSGLKAPELVMDAGCRDNR